MSKHTIRKVALGAVVAGAAGYLAGLLTAPKSGAKLRQALKQDVVRGADDTKERLFLLHDQLQELIDTATLELKDIDPKNKTKLADTIKKAKDLKEGLNGLIADSKKKAVNNKDLSLAFRESEKAIVHLKDLLLKK